MIACSFLSPLHAPLFLSRGSLQRGALLCLVPSLIQHSWAASFQLVVLCVMVQGALGCRGGPSSLLMAWDPVGFTSVTFWKFSLLSILFICVLTTYINNICFQCIIIIVLLVFSLT